MAKDEGGEGDSITTAGTTNILLPRKSSRNCGKNSCCRINEVGVDSRTLKHEPTKNIQTRRSENTLLAGG